MATITSVIVGLEHVQPGDYIVSHNGDGDHRRRVFGVDTTSDSIAFEGSNGFIRLDEPFVRIPSEATA